MTRRWRVRCVSVDGTVRYEATYLFRRSALEDARRLASALYDVIVEDARGRRVPLIWPHTPPDVLARRLGQR